MVHSEYIPVTAAVIERDGKILIAKRRVPSIVPPWEFPGGKLEDGESLEECLKREIREELHIEIEVGPLLCSNRHVIDCKTAITLYTYCAMYISGLIELVEHEEALWVDPEDLLIYDFAHPDRLIVSEIQQRYTKIPPICP
jgi:8-oxo-dGTP diphosphatase